MRLGYADKRIILFVSVARDTVHKWSDIDLVIIEETDLPYWQRLREIRALLKPTVGIDIFVYTSDEFEDLKRERAFVRESIVGEGVTLYERSQ